MINMMKACKGHVPLVSIDVPSGMCLFMLLSPHGAFIHSFFLKLAIYLDCINFILFEKVELISPTLT